MSGVQELAAGSAGPAPAAPPAALAPLPADLTPDTARAEIDRVKGSRHLMDRYLAGDREMADRMSMLYRTAYDQPLAEAAQPSDLPPEREAGYVLNLPEGFQPDVGLEQAVRTAAHGEGLGRAAFDVMSSRYFRLASNAESAMSAEACGERLTAWYGDRAQAVTTAAQQVARRLLAKHPELQPLLQAVDTDPWTQAALAEHELGRAGRR